MDDSPWGRNGMTYEEFYAATQRRREKEATDVPKDPPKSEPQKEASQTVLPTHSGSRIIKMAKAAIRKVSLLIGVTQTHQQSYRALRNGPNWQGRNGFGERRPDIAEAYLRARSPSPMRQGEVTNINDSYPHYPVRRLQAAMGKKDEAAQDSGRTASKAENLTERKKPLIVDGSKQGLPPSYEESQEAARRGEPAEASSHSRSEFSRNDAARRDLISSQRQRSTYSR